MTHLPPAADETFSSTPPAFGDVLAELENLRQRQGVTDKKVAKNGKNLMGLAISVDEYERLGGQLSMPQATIQALKCVADHYNLSHLDHKANPQVDLRRIVLQYELNLDQSIGYIWRQRRDAAMFAAKLGKTGYEQAADTILWQFAYDISTLKRSACRSSEEWQREQKRFIDTLPDCDVRQLLYLHMRSHPDVWKSTLDMASDLGLVMPNLMGSLQRHGIAISNDAEQILDTVIRSIGSRLYDEYARRYIRKSGGWSLVLPWTRVYPFVERVTEWRSEEFYYEIASRAYSDPQSHMGSPFLGEHSPWSFIDSNPNRPTSIFLRAIDASIALLADLIVRVDAIYGVSGNTVADTDVNMAVRHGSLADADIESIIGIAEIDIADIPISPIESWIAPPRPHVFQHIIDLISRARSVDGEGFNRADE